MSENELPIVTTVSLEEEVMKVVDNISKKY
jgi:hypothetical protein